MSHSKLESTISILPSFLDSEHRFSSLSSLLFYTYRSHCITYEKCSGDTNIIQEPIYSFEQLNVLIKHYEQGGRVIPESSLISLSDYQHLHFSDVHDVYQSYTKQLKFLQSVKSNEFLDLSFYQSSALVTHIDSLNDRLKEARRHQFNDIPIYIIPEKEISSDFNHIEQMVSNPRWILQLISFFASLTKNQITVSVEDISFDSFLYNPNGMIAAFISYDLLKIRPNMSLEKITDTNLRGFAKLIWSFFDYSARMLPDNTVMPKHDSLLYKLLQRMKSETDFEFNSFQEVANFIKNPDLTSKPRRFGVFLDVANIYTGLHNLKIDYHSLVLSVFGLEAKGRIKEENKHAVLFYPVYEDEEKTNDVYHSQKQLKETLENEFSFRVHETNNGTPKAKRIVNGKESDVDDEALIKKMEERFEYLDHILLLSGDAHFYEILMKYKQTEGKTVSIISIHEDDTSNRIRTDFKDEHKFITEYADCIII
ncbi:NYN domain-containing protein [Halalkalibacter urbisdiaboli]|uniref:NYN domain-containing protein n=1 Tax=Halalkalibacter urbisdiaboli TaxID=1960589 RepID=UPI000B450C01|nr:NYN domain-containing protein [Halalkalibacter urbisdiaboli]